MFLTPPGNWRTRSGAEEPFELTLTLVGRGRLRLPWMVGGLLLLGARGFGPHPVPFVLSKLDAEGPVGERTPLRVLSGGVGSRVPEMDISTLLAARPYRKSAVIHWVTPLDLLRDGRRVLEPDPKTLLKRLLRRLGDLARYHCGWSPESFVFDDMLTLAEGIECRGLDLKYHRSARVSHGQGGGMQPLEGVIGRMELANIPPEIWPYLVAGEWVHVGKSINFGLGKYVIDP